MFASFGEWGKDPFAYSVLKDNDTAEYNLWVGSGSGFTEYPLGTIPSLTNSGLMPLLPNVATSSRYGEQGGVKNRSDEADWNPPPPLLQLGIAVAPNGDVLVSGELPDGTFFNRHTGVTDLAGLLGISLQGRTLLPISIQ